MGSVMSGLWLSFFVILLDFSLGIAKWLQQLELPGAQATSSKTRKKMKVCFWSVSLF